MPGSRKRSWKRNAGTPNTRPGGTGTVGKAGGEEGPGGAGGPGKGRDGVPGGGGREGRCGRRQSGACRAGDAAGRNRGNPAEVPGVREGPHGEPEEILLCAVRIPGTPGGTESGPKRKILGGSPAGRAEMRGMRCAAGDPAEVLLFGGLRPGGAERAAAENGRLSERRCGYGGGTENPGGGE